MSKSESERVSRVARITNRAKEVFEDSEMAQRWLNKPLVCFQGKTALEYADTEKGCIEVERLLGRIEHGVFS